MGVALQLRRGTTTALASFTTGKEGELVLDTTVNTLYVCDSVGGKHVVGSGTGGSTVTYDEPTGVLTIDGTDISFPELDTSAVNSLITDAIALIPEVSGLTITDLNTLQTQLESKIDLDNQVQDITIAAVSTIQAAHTQSIAVLAASATATSDEIAASVVTDLYAQIGTNASGLQSEQSVRTTADSTIAQSVTNLQSAFDTNTATVNTQLTSLATADTTIAQAITTVETTVGGNTAAISTTSQSINGIEAKHSIVINAGGDVTGFEMLGGGGAGSQIKFTTDNFVIAGSGAGDRNPFSVSGGNVSIDGDLIATGTLSASKITAGTSTVAAGLSFSLGTGSTIGGYGAAASFNSTALGKAGMVAASTNPTQGYGIGAGAIGADPALIAVHGSDPAFATWTTAANLAGVNYAASFTGDLHINGGTVHPFTGAHQALTEVVGTVGDIVVDTEIVSKSGVSDVLTKVALSTTTDQKGVVGVYAATQDKSLIPHSISDPVEGSISQREVKSEYSSVFNQCDLISINSLGEGQVNVCGEGGDLEIGDLIVTSSIAGKGKKQGDDILRAATVAKVREAVTFSNSTEVKMVAAIYLCG